MDLNTLNFKDLEAEFTKACPDYGKIGSEDVKSQALGFSAKVLFEVGPESGRNKNSDLKWTFKFEIPKPDDPKDVTRTTVYVCSFRVTPAPTKQPTFENGQLILTVDQASLLAVTMVIKCVPHTIASGKIMLTPLAGAVFSINDVHDIADALQMDKNGLATINSSILASCQKGGHFIKESECHIAKCAAIVGTSKMKDKNRAKNIVDKVVKQYVNVGKHLDHEKFEIFCNNSFGYQCMSFDVEEIIAQFDRIQLAARLERMNKARANEVGTTPPESVNSNVQPEKNGRNDENTKDVGGTNLTPEGGAIKKNIN